MCIRFFEMALPSFYKAIIVFLCFCHYVKGENSSGKPNIVLIVADDMGWNDVSFHGSDQILTPNIDLLAYTGVALGRYYSHCICTPSRSSLLTGKYGHTVGMQGFPLTNAEDRGLPITEKILPQYLKEHGYATHLVGKWHLGHSRTEYLPTKRGFDTHFGHRGGYIDYYEYVLEEAWINGKESGLDLFRNTTPAWDTEGYLTDVYNQEAKSIIENHDTRGPLFLMLGHNAPHSGNDGALLQAPRDEVRNMRHIDSIHRRIYGAMVKKLDDSVGDVIEALNKKGIIENTIIVFISDNGGMTAGDSLNYASNYPLRGLKMTPFEGGIRVTGLLWSKNLNNTNHFWNGYMHVSDWVPTLLKAADIAIPTKLDGKNLWENINTNQDSDRDEIVEMDDYTGFSAVILDDYKLIKGTIEHNYSNHQGADLRGVIGKGPSYSDSIKKSKTYSVLKNIGKSFDINDIKVRNQLKIECGDVKQDLCYPQKDKVCLFNIREDPCEYRDISASHPDIVSRLESRLESQTLRLLPRIKPLYRDPRGRPKLHNYTWTSWADNLEKISNNNCNE